jgi:hypothetical protein
MTITDLELSFQFPIKRVGASPVVSAGTAVAGVSSTIAGSEVSGAADSVATGAGVDPSSLSLPEVETMIAPITRIPSRTAKRIFDEELLLEPAAGFEDGAAWVAAAEVRGAAGAGVVETLTRAPPIAGTGGITTCDATFLRAADFFTAFFAVVCFAVVFLAVVFFAVDFLATFFAALFFTTVFLAVFLALDFFTTFFAALFLAVVFFGAAFFAADFFFTATVIS